MLNWLLIYTVVRNIKKIRCVNAFRSNLFNLRANELNKLRMHTNLIVIFIIFQFRVSNSDEKVVVEGDEDLPTSAIISPYDFHPDKTFETSKYQTETLEKKSAKAPSESYDMTHFNITPSDEEVIIYTFPTQDQVAFPKLDAELIENGGNTEDDFMAPNLNFSRHIFQVKRHTREGQNRLAIILATSLFFACLTGLMAVLYWRRYIERYGYRQRLSNEEEFIKDDMKHFSL